MKTTGSETVKKRFFRKKTRDAFFIYGVLAWPIIHFLIFWFGMNFSMVINAFRAENILGEVSWNGISNFTNVLKVFGGIKEPAGIITQKALFNALSLAPLALFINLPITLFFSFAIYKKVFGHQVFRIVLFIPSIISVVILCLVFKLAVDSQYGFVNEILRKLGLGGAIPWGGWLGDAKTAWPTILVFSIWTGVSGNLIYFSSAMARIPASLIESARLDGASALKQFTHIILPLIWPIITTLSIGLVSAIFGWFMPSLLLTNGGPDGATSTIALIITSMTRAGSNNGFVSALGVLIAIIGGAFIVGFKALMNKLGTEVEY